MNDEKNKPLLVPGYMPRGQINIWAGDGGSGKTTAGRREVYNLNFPHQHGVLNLENSIFQPLKKA